MSKKQQLEKHLDAMGSALQSQKRQLKEAQASKYSSYLVIQKLNKGIHYYKKQVISTYRMLQVYQ